MNEYTLSERDILAIIKVALDGKTVLNSDMSHELISKAESLVLTDLERHDAAVHVINTYYYAHTL